MEKQISDYFLRALTGLKSHERKNVFTWLGSLPETEVIDIVQRGVKESFAMQKSRPDLPGKVIKYCSLIVAARHLGWNTYRGKGYRVATPKQYADFSKARKAKAAELITRGRKPILRKKVLAYWGEIRELREGNHSFREISSYLGRKRKLKVSSSYLSRMWKEVENAG